MVAKGESSNRGVAVGIGAAVVVALAAGWWFWRATPPQMGSSDQVFAAVDALFTAVNARNEALLGQCETRLGELAASGELTADGAEFLSGVVAQCRAGEWAPSAQRLYEFMAVQRRER